LFPNFICFLLERRNLYVIPGREPTDPAWAGPMTSSTSDAAIHPRDADLPDRLFGDLAVQPPLQNILVFSLTQISA
jgi:hypothetical protein